MKLQTVLSALVLPLLSLAAKKPSAVGFDKWQSKAVSSTPISIDDSTYSQLTASPRDYGVVMCHTALGAQYGCKICQDLKPEWAVLGKSWLKGDPKGASRTLFATIDFSEGRQTFQSLQLETAPVLIYYPPTTGPFSTPGAQPVRFDFSAHLAQAEGIHAWATRHMHPDQPKPAFNRPINWGKFAVIGLLVVGGITGVLVAWPIISYVIQSKNLWASMSIVAVLLFTSGHMFNSIRGTPYYAGDGKGGIQYFAPGFSNQYGMESQIIAAIYAVLAFATIGLAVQVPRMADSSKQTVGIFMWLAVSYLMYGFLMGVFRIKNGGYPYTLPPF